jgi:hypothetical protein
MTKGRFGEEEISSIGVSIHFTQLTGSMPAGWAVSPRFETCGSSRSLMRLTDAPPLGTIRSLAYFLPVIDEVFGLRVTL